MLALQLPTANINAVMTGNQDWDDDGLGETGETYLVGPRPADALDVTAGHRGPRELRGQAIDGGTPPDVAARAARVGGTILIQPVDTPQVERALRGETGEMIADDYLGNEVLAAYTPVELGDLGWVVIAEIDTSEAFAPVDDFTRRHGVRHGWDHRRRHPRLAAAGADLLPAGQAADGRSAARSPPATSAPRSPSSSTDEFADLAAAFNDMSRSLQTKQELLEAEQAENERLLLTMMPETVAQRYRQGEQTISEDHQDVAVVFADIVGFDDYAGDLDSATSLAQLNELVRQFDEAAEQIGVERVRTLRNGYLASCGLILPRVDNALRAIDFAR